MRSIKLQGQSMIGCIDVAEPEPGPGEVIVETRVSAVCGSELKAYKGVGKERGNTGHEAAGVITRLGPGVSALKEGQRVGVSAVFGCGQCSYCDKGQNTWCPDRGSYSDMHAERFVTSVRACHPLPDELSWEVGTLISGDGFGVPYHTSTKLKNEPLEYIAIFGMGPIGLGNTLMQTYLGRQVIAVDISSQRLALAKELGASHTIHPNDADVVEQLRDLTGGRGADVCIEAAGQPLTARQCFAAVRTGGTVVFNGEQPSIKLSPSTDFIRRDITALGSWYYQYGQFPAMLEIYRSGLALERLITHRFPMEEAAQAFQLMAAGLTGKAVLHYASADEVDI